MLKAQEMDKAIASTIKSQNCSIILKSYIAYLALHDLQRLAGKSRVESKKLFHILPSEINLAYFEDRKIGENCLFEGERLREFFPELAGADHFVTGLFAEALLSKEKTIEHPWKECLYEVEIE